MSAARQQGEAAGVPPEFTGLPQSMLGRLGDQHALVPVFVEAGKGTGGAALWLCAPLQHDDWALPSGCRRQCRGLPGCPTNFKPQPVISCYCAANKLQHDPHLLGIPHVTHTRQGQSWCYCKVKGHMHLICLRACLKAPGTLPGLLCSSRAPFTALLAGPLT